MNAIKTAFNYQTTAITAALFTTGIVAYRYASLAKIMAASAAIAVVGGLLKHYFPTPPPPPPTPAETLTPYPDYGTLVLCDLAIASSKPRLRPAEHLKALETHLSKEDAQKVHAYIEAQLPAWRADRRAVMIHPDEEPNLPRTVQYVPETDSVFVLLNRKKMKDPVLGQGVSKRATQALCYATGELLARSVTDISRQHPIGQEELQYIQRLNGKPGIIQTFAIHSYSRPSKYLKLKQPAQKWKTAYVQEKMDSSLSDCLYGKNFQRLTRQQKLDIAHDILLGVKSMHAANIFHRDLHMGNVLIAIDPNTQQAKARITDFGLNKKARTVFGHLHLRKADIAEMLMTVEPLLSINEHNLLRQRCTNRWLTPSIDDLYTFFCQRIYLRPRF
ncbi:MAG: protein kinase family protein [Chlamydiia bacterium]|nr:protein kinase family protein [Chlamydiia bacterium]